jgi:Protein of unknown function (DUF2971).
MILYKYYNVSDITIIKKLLKENLHKFSTPLEFNDPFDCRLNLIKEYSSKQYHEYLIKKGLSHVLITKNLKLYRDGQINLINIINSISDKQLKNARILCFTTKYDDMLMWSHYANKHQGICIGYNVKNYGKKYYLHINQNDLKGNSVGNDHVLIEKVKYSKKMPKRHNLLNGDLESFRAFLLTKSYDWKYEREFRCILSEEDMKNKLIHFSKNDIAEIIIGCKAQDIIQQEILKYVDSKSIRVFKLTLEMDSYQLKKNLTTVST